MQPLREEMERLARFPAIGLGEPDEPIDERPPRTNLGGLSKEHAVGLQQLLLKDLLRRADHLQAPVTLELSQVPPEERRVADELVRGHFEQDDHASLVELAGATIHELDPERRLPRTRASRADDDVPPRNAAEKDFVEPLDSCLDQV